MTEPNELRFDDLEKRVTKIEEYIRCNKEVKEQQWKTSLDRKLENIEDHLKRQDKKLENGTYFSGYLFGATLIFIAFSLLAGKYILTTEFWYVTYCIVILIGGTGLIGFAWYKRSKPPK